MFGDESAMLVKAKNGTCRWSQALWASLSQQTDNQQYRALVGALKCSSKKPVVYDSPSCRGSDPLYEAVGDGDIDNAMSHARGRPGTLVDLINDRHTIASFAESQSMESTVTSGWLILMVSTFLQTVHLVSGNEHVEPCDGVIA